MLNRCDEDPKAEIEDLYSELELQVLHPRNRKKSFAVLEGDSDIVIYKKILDDPDGCFILPKAGWGRGLIEKAFPVPDKYRQRTFAIIDCDFDYSCPDRKYKEGLIPTPTHDLETLTFSTPAFERLIALSVDPNERAAAENRCGMALSAAVLRAARPLGLLRLLDFRRKRQELPGMNFDNTPFGKLIDPDTFSPRVDDMVNWVLKINTNNSEIRRLSVSNILAELSKLDREYPNDWLVCQGHDVVALFLLVMNIWFGSDSFRHTFTHAWLRKCLGNMAILSTEDLESTGLCDRIRGWEDAHEPYRALKTARIS